MKPVKKQLEFLNFGGELYNNKISGDLWRVVRVVWRIVDDRVRDNICEKLIERI